MTRGEALSRLCALVSKVGTEVFHDDLSHDCFFIVGNNFLCESGVIEYIEAAVNEKLQEVPK